MSLPNSQSMFSPTASQQRLFVLLMETLVPQAYEKHMKAQATWPEITDNDRLDVAFASWRNGTASWLVRTTVTVLLEGTPIR